MPTNTNRYKKFLTSYDFFPNSIDFRIHSSKALEKWKNVQAFQLNQLINGRFYFGQYQREILLLNYDLWSKWLYQIEAFCIEVSNKKKQPITDPSDIEFISAITKKVHECIDRTIAENPEYFNEQFTKVWSAQHDNMREYMFNKIGTFTGISINTFFTACVDLITDIMQHSLIEIHEIDSLCNSNKNSCGNIPFLIVNDFNEKAFQKFGKCLISERLAAYKQFFEIDEICVKNYTEDPIPCGIADRIETMGVKINYRLSSRFDAPKPKIC